MVAVWLSCSSLVLIIEVALRWAALVLGWVTMFILVCNQQHRSTQPSHPLWVGTVSISISYGINDTPPNALAMYLWSHSISWCLAEGYRNRDQHRAISPCGSGRILHFFTSSICTIWFSAVNWHCGTASERWSTELFSHKRVSYMM